MQFRRFVLVVVGLMLALSLAQSSAQAHNEDPAHFKLYVGSVVDSPDVFVALAISEGKATLYICDGQADKSTVTFGEWFIGPVKDNAIDIAAPSGNRVQVAINDPAADGHFTFKDNTVKKFGLKLAEDAKLNRSEFAFGDTKYVAGWIVFADGTARGSVRRDDGQLTPATFVSMGGDADETHE